MKKLIPTRLLIVCVLVITVAILFIGLGYTTEDLPLGHLAEEKLTLQEANGTSIDFNVEVAVTDAEREKGLMFRRSMDPKSGMIFVWKQDQPIIMWMKNTYIPLDMLFVGRDGRIDQIVRNAQPLDRSLIRADRPAHAVIELNGGAVEQFHINTGDHVTSPSFEASKLP